MNADLRIETLGHDSLALSQERTENGTGVTRHALQNESQPLELQGHTLEAVIPEPYHLPECMEPQTDWPCKQCWEIDCECTCICERLRACEKRVLGLRLDDLNIKSFNAALDAAREALTEALNALPIKWTSDELFPAVLTIHQVFDQLAGDKP